MKLIKQTETTIVLSDRSNCKLALHGVVIASGLAIMLFSALQIGTKTITCDRPEPGIVDCASQSTNLLGLVSSEKQAIKHVKQAKVNVEVSHGTDGDGETIKTETIILRTKSGEVALKNSGRIRSKSMVSNQINTFVSQSNAPSLVIREQPEVNVWLIASVGLVTINSLFGIYQQLSGSPKRLVFQKLTINKTSRTITLKQGSFRKQQSTNYKFSSFRAVQIDFSNQQVFPIQLKSKLKSALEIQPLPASVTISDFIALVVVFPTRLALLPILLLIPRSLVRRGKSKKSTLVMGNLIIDNRSSSIALAQTLSKWIGCSLQLRIFEWVFDATEQKVLLMKKDRILRSYSVQNLSFQTEKIGKTVKGEDSFGDETYTDTYHAVLVTEDKERHLIQAHTNLSGRKRKGETSEAERNAEETIKSIQQFLRLGESDRST